MAGELQKPIVSGNFYRTQRYKNQSKITLSTISKKCSSQEDRQRGLVGMGDGWLRGWTKVAYWRIRGEVCQTLKNDGWVPPKKS